MGILPGELGYPTFPQPEFGLVVMFNIANAVKGGCLGPEAD